MRELEPRDLSILRMRFVEDLTQTQIAAAVGITQMQVSRLLRRSLDQLRASSDPHAEAPSADEGSDAAVA
jgi:RNA polymerase sigma-B factor